MCQVLEQLSVSVNYDSSSVYVESYLPYLMHTWVECNTGTLLEFPWQLTGCESQTAFLRFVHCSAINLSVLLVSQCSRVYVIVFYM